MPSQQSKPLSVALPYEHQVQLLLRTGWEATQSINLDGSPGPLVDGRKVTIVGVINERTGGKQHFVKTGEESPPDGVSGEVTSFSSEATFWHQTGAPIMVGAQQQSQYGKKELVELLTGQVIKEPLGWVEVATNVELSIQESDMPRVYAAVMSYKANRIRSYGEDGAYVKYFTPAFKPIEEGFSSNNFSLFREGCELLLGLIAKD